MYFMLCYLIPKCNIAYYCKKSSINQMLFPFLVAVVRIISNRWIQATGPVFPDSYLSRHFKTFAYWKCLTCVKMCSISNNYILGFNKAEISV